MLDSVLNILGVIGTALGLWSGSVEWRLRTIDQRLRDAPSREEVQQSISLNMLALKQQTRDLKEDLHRLENKIDTLIAIQIKGRSD